MPSVNDNRKELCTIALAIAELGLAAPEYIAARLRMPLHRVRSALAVMEAFGWVRRVDANSSLCPCSKCPLRRVCPVTSIRRLSHVYRVEEKVINYCKQIVQDNRDK